MTDKTGVLLINLGTPDKPTTRAVRRYLKQFLLDPYVITLPAPLRYLLVYGAILPFRPKQSAHAYQKIWGEDGSPLLTNSVALAKKVAIELGENYHVELGMRYGKPSIDSAVKKLKKVDCKKIIVLPLFPQYAKATNQSAIDEAKRCLKKNKLSATLDIIPDFYQENAFIEPSSELIKRKIKNTTTQFVLFSYHGLPERQIEITQCPNQSICDDAVACPVNLSQKTQCYRAQCFATTQQIAEKMGLSSEDYATSFQSRLGKTKWIGPYTDQILSNLREQGILHLAVACPSFVADCLETLEEIGIQLREQWESLGGKSFCLIPCLNDNNHWVAALSAFISAR